MSRKEEGMTILEVVLAITILLMGTTFIVQSNYLSNRYLKEQQLRQKMVFFAAGRMEAALEGDIKEFPLENLVAKPVLPDVSLKLTGDDYNLNSYLSCFGVEVSVLGSSDHKIRMYNFKLELPEP